MGSSRFAEPCRLPHPAIMRGSRCGPIRARPLRVSNGMRSCDPRSRKFGTIIGRSTGCAKPGDSCAVKVKLLRAARLMTGMGLRGVVRGKAVKTTIPDVSVPCPRDKVNRKFRAPAPNMLWVSDFTYVSTWQGFVYVAFVIDTFANRIVGWKASRSAKTDFVLDALEQALYARHPTHKGGLIHHSDRGSQYVSIRYTERLGNAGIEPSVGSVGDAYDRASGRHWFKTTGEGFGRNHKRPLQNRGHPAAQFMENCGRGRTGNPQMALRRCKHRLPANRSTGITIAACLAQSVTSHPPKQRRRSMQS